jgi:hypothetical protein
VLASSALKRGCCSGGLRNFGVCPSDTPSAESCKKTGITREHFKPAGRV